MVAEGDVYVVAEGDSKKNGEPLDDKDIKIMKIKATGRGGR